LSKVVEVMNGRMDERRKQIYRVGLMSGKLLGDNERSPTVSHPINDAMTR